MSVTIRCRGGDERAAMKRLPPLDAIHAAAGHPCVCCDTPFVVGDVTVIIPLGPGASVEDRAAALRGDWFMAVGARAHDACAGRLRGKQPKLSATQEHELVALHAAGELTVAQVGARFGVARSTVYRALDRARRYA